MECLSGRGAEEWNPFRLLSRTYRKMKVHASYVQEWESLVDGLLSLRMDCSSDERPTETLSYSQFNRYWSRKMPTIRIAKCGSYLCDFCTLTQNQLKSWKISDSRREEFKKILKLYRDDAAGDFSSYKQMQANCVPDRFCHLTFEFAENILISQLTRKPSQLQFLTGLKYNMFDVSCSNLQWNFVYGMTDGHWPNNKTADTVLSMLHYGVLNAYRLGMPKNDVLKLTADNCIGKNMNQYILYYLAWRFESGLNGEISLSFLVAEHTKNCCYGNFGNLRRYLRHSDGHNPR